MTQRDLKTCLWRHGAAKNQARRLFLFGLRDIGTTFDGSKGLIVKLGATFAAFFVLGAATQAVAGPEDMPMTALAMPVKASEESPWFQKFTFGSGYSTDVNGWSSGAVSGDSESMRVVTEGKRWGMSLSVRDKKDWAPLGQAGARDKVAAGAFYNITPRVRFGGEMTLESRGANPGSGRDSAMEPGVKIGSAFRF